MTNKRTEGKIKTHYGIRDYYKHYKSTCEDPVDYKTYSKVISEFNESVIHEILNSSQEYNIPHLDLVISIRKDERKPKIKDGKLYNNSPVDWYRTNRLWDRDPEAKEKKILVRYLNTHTSGFVFRIYCKKFSSRLKNKSFYKFKPSRNFQRKLSERIKDNDKDSFDCFMLHKDA